MTTPYTSYLVAPAHVGVELDMDSWLLPQDAYVDIQNGYNYLGVIYKREGYVFFDAIPHALNLGAYQNITSLTNTGGASVVVTTIANHGLSSNTIIRLTGVGGLTPKAGEQPINGTDWVITVTGAQTFTLNNTIGYTGVYTGATGTVSNFPRLPVTMIANYIPSGTNSYQMVVCDTRRGAYFDSSAECLTPIGYQDQFSGTYANQFWFENYSSFAGVNTLFITNNKDTPFYWQFSGGQIAAGFTAFTPQYGSGGGDTVTQCLMIKGINGRLCLLNTFEAGTAFPVRIRYSQQNADPLNNASWDDVAVGDSGGGAFDLQDSNYIIALAQIQFNILIFSQAQQLGIIYEMRPTNDPQNPFVFVKIANSRNVNSTFGTIVYDRQVAAVGNLGLVSTDGNSVGRIDDKIPEFVQNSMMQSQINLCFGIRNDAYWQGWTLYPSSDQASPGKNTNILVYNYKDGSWSFHDMAFSCLGLAINSFATPTWASYNDSVTWQSFADNETWLSVPQNDAFLLYAGDYNGFIWTMNEGAADGVGQFGYQQPINTPIPITFSLTTRQWAPFVQEGASAELGYVDFLIDSGPDVVVTVEFFADNSQSPYLTTYFTTVPFENLTGGPISNVSQTSPAVVTAINHGLITGDIVSIYAVQGMNQINGLRATVTFVDNDNFSLNGVDSTMFSPYLTDGVFSLKAITQSQFWTRVYVGGTGVFHQMVISTISSTQGFAIHAIMPWFKKTGRLFKG